MAVKKLNSNCLKITTETMRTTQEVISKTNLTAGQNPDNHIDKLARLRNLLTKIGEPITDRRFTDIVPETPTDEKRDIKLMT